VLGLWSVVLYYTDESMKDETKTNKLNIMKDLLNAHIEKYGNLFPEGFGMDTDILLEYHPFRMKIYATTKGILTCDGHRTSYHYHEEGHVILFDTGDLDIFYGSSESLKYFADKYMTEYK